MTRIQQLALSVSLALCLGAVGPASAAGPDIDKVNGGITAEAGQAYGDLSTVNGGIRVEKGARIDTAETVNGGIRVEADVQADELSTVNGGIRAGENLQTRGGLSTVNGGIFVDRGGRIGGGIETVNGAIGLVDTDVAGDIETVSGDLTVGAGSHVRGGIKYHKPRMQWFAANKRDPRVVIGPQARVDGPLVFERKVNLLVHRTARTGPVTGATAVVFESASPPQD